MTLRRPRSLLALALAGAACTTTRTEPEYCAPLEPPELPTPSELDASGSGMDAPPGGDAGAPGSTSNPWAPNLPRAESDAHTAEVDVAVHARVRTVLVVTWTQALAADEVWLEFTYEDGEVMRSRPKPGTVGPRRDVVLGVPAQTEVSLRIVSRVVDAEFASSVVTASTGALPGRMPVPEVFSYDARHASPERWLFGSVEDSIGGSYSGYYLGTFWLYIMDRRGRIVWYYADPASNATSSFQRVARDGEYIWIEKRAYSGAGDPSVVKMTLDGEYFEEIPVPGLSDSIDVTDDGSLLYDQNGDLHELLPSGENRSIWSCSEHFGAAFHCYTNTVNWYALEDTVLLSFPYQNTVVELDRATGRLVGQYGSATGSYRFAPPASSPPESWSFSFQHFPNRTPTGTLLVSSHVPGCAEDAEPGRYRHAFVEFEIDRDARRLIERWRYTGGREWPRAKGMAIRVTNGNTLGNYGTGGVIREVTPEGRTVFGVKFDVDGGNDFYNEMVGHNVLIDDLYSLNGGPL